MPDTRVFIVHGYTAAPSSHWFPWLAERLRERGAAVDVIPLPNSDKPDPHAWDECLRDHIGVPDEGTHFVAHSLGCVSLLKYLQAWPHEVRIGTLILVAGFADRLLNFPELDPFVTTPVDFATVQRLTKDRHVFVSDNDVYVHPHHTEKLAEDLQARLHRKPGAGHFLGSEGFERLDEVLALLEARIKDQGT